LTREGDLIGSGSHQDYASQSAAQVRLGTLRLVNREIYRLAASYPRYHHRPLSTLCSPYACAAHYCVRADTAVLRAAWPQSRWSRRLRPFSAPVIGRARPSRRRGRAGRPG
jgi:hypothetical protein